MLNEERLGMFTNFLSLVLILNLKGAGFNT